MSKSSLSRLFLYAFCISLLFSCTKGKEMTTNAGFRYILYTDAKGPNPALDDFVTIEMVYKTAGDSVLFDSRKNSKPLRFALEKIPFEGSYEDGLTFLCAGDSATFYVPADSMFRYYFIKQGKNVPQEQTEFKKGTFLKFDIKLIRIQSRLEAEQEIALEQSKREKAGDQILEKYISEHHLESYRDTAGYYLIYTQRGNGNQVDSGLVISVNYSGKFLDGRTFDSNAKLGQPYRFVLGARQVIPGWEKVFGKLCEGDKINLLLPARLAYGGEGFRDPRDGTFIVPTYAPLLFEIEVVKIEKIHSIAGK